MREHSAMNTVFSFRFTTRPRSSRQTFENCSPTAIISNQQRNYLWYFAAEQKCAQQRQPVSVWWRQSMNNVSRLPFHGLLRRFMYACTELALVGLQFVVNLMSVETCNLENYLYACACQIRTVRCVVLIDEQVHWKDNNNFHSMWKSCGSCIKFPGTQPKSSSSPSWEQHIVWERRTNGHKLFFKVNWNVSK